MPLPESAPIAFINYMSLFKTDVDRHPNFDITHRVFECLDYIEQHLNTISEQAGKAGLLRHPENHLAFHLHGMNTPHEVKNNFTQLLSQVRGCLEQLFSIQDDATRKAIAHSFLLNINDSPVGCMEARLRPAMDFFVHYQANGCMHINDMMQAFHAHTNGDYSIGALLDYFSKKVEHHVPVKDVDDNIKPLDWSMVKNYLHDTLEIDNIENEWLDYINTLAAPVSLPEGRWCHYYFSDNENAEHYLAYIKSLLPAFASDLSKASIKQDKNNGYSFRLTSQQAIALQKILNSAQEKKKEDGVNKQSSAPPAISANDSPIDKLIKGDVLIKSIRWDNECFLPEFLEGITPNSTQPKKKSPLRSGKHKPWTVYGTGVFERQKNKPSPYGLTPDVLAKQKAERSQPQSTSLISLEIQAPVFGHNRKRGDKLVGFLFDANDALVNRYFKYDGGTINRPYEFENKTAADHYFNQKVNSQNPILFASADPFKAAIKNQADSYNEVLARIRWNNDSSCIGIFSDTPEARYIAQYYAEQLKYRLKEQAEAEGKHWDDTYQPPIVYYIPGNEKNWTPYTEKEQQQDRDQAEASFNDPNKLKAALDEDKAEFLLLIKDPFAALNSIGENKSFFNNLASLLKINPSSINSLQMKEPPHLAVALLTRCAYTKYTKQTEMIGQPSAASFPAFQNQSIKMLLKRGGIKTLLWAIQNVRANTSSEYQAHFAFKLLIWAAEKGHSECMQALLADPRTDPNQRNKYGLTALILAAYRGHTECVKALLADIHTDPNLKNMRDDTALFLAANNGHTECMQALLADPRTDPNLKNKDGNTALFLAANNRRTNCLKVLLTDPRTNTNIMNKDGHTALMCAAGKGRTECVKALLADPRTDPNLINTDGETAITKAAYYGRTDCVKALLADPRTNPNLCKYYYNPTALIIAASNGSTDCMNALLADPRTNTNLIDRDGETAITKAAYYGRTDCVKALLADRRTNPNKSNYYGFTPLIQAASKGHLNCVKALLADPRINPNLKIKRGKTALYFAARDGHIDCVEALLADPRIDLYSNDSLGIAKNFGNTEFIKRRIHVYLDELEKRKEEFKPRFALIATLFNNKGFSKTEKKQAAKNLLAVLEGTQASLSPEDIAALQNGKLGEIVKYLPAADKNRAGLQ